MKRIEEKCEGRPRFIEKLVEIDRYHAWEQLGIRLGVFLLFRFTKTNVLSQKTIQDLQSPSEDFSKCWLPCCVIFAAISL